MAEQYNSEEQLKTVGEAVKRGFDPAPAKEMAYMAAAPVVGASRLANPAYAAITGAYESFAKGVPLEQAFDENLGEIRKLQDQVTEHSLATKWLAGGGELAAAMAIPGSGLIKGATGAAYAMSAGQGSLKDMVGAAKGGVALGGPLGAVGKYAAGKIPQKEEMVYKAREKMVQYFESTKKFVQEKLRFVEGKTGAEKMTNYTNFLAKKAIALDDTKSIAQTSRQIQEATEATNNVKKAFEQEAFLKNPEVDALSLYSQIKNHVSQVLDKPSEKKFVDDIFRAVFDEKSIPKSVNNTLKMYPGKTASEFVGKKKLTEIEDIYRDLKSKYPSSYDKMAPDASKKKAIQEGLDILKKARDEAIEAELTRQNPKKALDYVRTRNEVHLLEQTKKFADERVYGAGAKIPKEKAQNIKYSPFQKAGEVLETVTHKTPEQMIRMAPYAGAAKSFVGTGQKIPVAVGEAMGPERGGQPQEEVLDVPPWEM